MIEIGNFLVAVERAGEVVELSQVVAKNERRARDGPQCEFGALLVLRVAGWAIIAEAGIKVE